AAPDEGQHRIIYLPLSSLTRSQCNSVPCRDRRPDPFAPGYFLRVRFRYKLFEGQSSFMRDERTHRMMYVQDGQGQDFPSLHGASHYFDPHYHTIAEYWPGTYILGPAKAYGGPLQMLAASAWALGFTSAPTLQAARGNLITTDHNTFFDDTYAPAGPAEVARWGAPSGPLSGDVSQDGSTGSPEMDIYRGLLGRTAGEEVSLMGDRTSFVGRHALLYDSNYHVNGVWGTPDSIDPPAHCTPTVTNYLRRLAGGPNGEGQLGDCGSLSGIPDDRNGRTVRMIGGFTYAAHPFLAPSFEWDDDTVRRAASLPPLNSNELIQVQGSGRSAQRNFAFRGFQFWNWRDAQHASPSGLNDLRRLNLRRQNPYAPDEDDEIGPWQPNCGAEDQAGYRQFFHVYLMRYLSYVRDGLQMSFLQDAAPRPRFFRKLFMVTGSDAHGDFNWHEDILSTRLQNASTAGGMLVLHDGGFGRPRTYVFNDEWTPLAGPNRPLEDLRRGRAVLTDGPVMMLSVDAEARGHWTRNGRISWHDGELRAEDEDGRVGGDGELDGARTALIPYVVGAPDDEAQRIMVETACLNLPEFGGTQPTRWDLWISGPAGSSEPPRRIELLDDGPMTCDRTLHERRVDLGNIERPVALLGHVEFNQGCPAIYDAWTNPIWLAPVRVTVPEIRMTDTDETLSHRWRLEVDAASPEPRGVFTLEFPISMLDQ
ncbi:MAG: hypothetical protein K8H88_17305, partial [Sandaracinaceae bacterium]|nr:hypothetical protein [Sandaracinaceae bacterium]